MKYAIGLDIGIASVGFSAVELDGSDNPFRIIKLGSRIFNAAENAKDGASLAAPRRDARSMRRRLRRHRHRLERIRQLIVNNSILTQDELDSLFEGQLSDIYELRSMALDKPVDRIEFARILINLAQRRGFKSNRKSDESDKEAGKLLSAVKSNNELMAQKGYRTIGEMLLKDEKFALVKRNKEEDYSNTFSRELIENEAKLIFSAQRALGQSFASEDIEANYIGILTSQRSFEDGPAEPSPYFGNQIEKMIGKCIFETETEEPRAPKASYSFELFSLLQNINNIRVICEGQPRPLTKGERERIANLAHKTPDLNYAKIRKELELPDSAVFNYVSYGKNSVEEAEKGQKFNFLKGYHEMRKALDKVSKGYISYIPAPKLDEIARIFTVYKTDDKLKTELTELELPSEVVEALLGLPAFTKFGHLSLVACNKILPFLKEGMKYDEAVTAAGYNFRGHDGGDKSLTLKPDIVKDIPNPVVRRAVSQTIKVINALIREMGGSPTFLNIELAREMSKNRFDRDKADREMKKNAQYNESILEEIKSTHPITQPKGQDIVKYKLWKEQDGVCVYSLRPMEIERLFEPGYVDIDHIIPLSNSFDDSYNNKVLVFTNENRQKGNRLPMEYLTGEKRDRFEVWVNSNIRNYKKRQKLLKPKFTEEDKKAFIERNLNDTKYISSFMYNYINDNLAFADYFSPDKKRHVFAVNGSVTAYLRKRWGIAKLREDGDLHHAVDATVVACTTQGMINRVSKYSVYDETRFWVTDAQLDTIVDRTTGEVFDKFPAPWAEFGEELKIRTSSAPDVFQKIRKLKNYIGLDYESIQPCFVSRMPRRKVKGEAHLATVGAKSERGSGYIVNKRPLTALKLNSEGEIEGYYNPSSDRLLYDALRYRLLSFGGNAKAAFEQSIYKPTSTGKQGPLVKKVKIEEKESLSVPVHNNQALAKNSSMVRVDVFKVEGEGYYYVPIYVSDTLKEQLPSKACVAHKDSSQWKEMSDDHFVFSLYHRDLLRATSSEDMTLSLVNKQSALPKTMIVKDIMLYVEGFGIGNATFSAITHDNTYRAPSIGKTILSIEKYQVDPLGNYTKVNKEKRITFSGQ